MHRSDVDREDATAEQSGEGSQLVAIWANVDARDDDVALRGGRVAGDCREPSGARYCAESCAGASSRCVDRIAYAVPSADLASEPGPVLIVIIEHFPGAVAEEPREV